MIDIDQEHAPMNYDDRRPIIPLRPAPDALRDAAMRSVARAAIHACKNAGKTTPDRNPWRDDPAVELLTRSPVSPTSTAATALTQIRVHFLPSLIPTSAAAAVLDQSFQFSFDGAAQISAPSVSLPTAGWIGEGQAIPVIQGTSTANTPLTPFKLAAIVVLSREMIEAGDAEAVMAQVLKENIGASLDAVFFNANAASSGVSPAGILNGAISVTAAASGSAAIVQDIAALEKAVAAVSGNSRMVIVAAPAQASAIRSVIIDPPPTFASNALADKTVVGIVPAAIASANSTPIIQASKEVTLHMAAPAAELVASPSTVAAPQRSVYQTDSLALRFTQELSWTKRGAGVAMITGANWP
jgi:hypothetical protein